MDAEPDYRWHTTDTYSELLDALDLTLEKLRELASKPSAFKWIVLGSVLTLQGACVFQLDGHDTTSTSTLTAESRKKVLDHLHNQIARPFPAERMASPIELVRRVSLPGETSNDFSMAWDRIDLSNCEYLVGLRNEFVHFLPQGWSICLNGFPQVLGSCWKIVGALLSAPIKYEHRLPTGFKNKALQGVQSVLVEIDRLEGSI